MTKREKKSRCWPGRWIRVQEGMGAKDGIVIYKWTREGRKEMTQTLKITNLPQVTPIANILHTTVLTRDELIGKLIERALELDGRGDILIVEYTTDMLAKGKLRAAAKAAFQNGIFRSVRSTVNVNYDYGQKLENRTGGEETAVGASTWQQAVIINGKKTPLTVHKADVATETPLTFIKGARVYLRYEPLTDNQKAAGFAKGDYSIFTDGNGNGNEISYQDVKPYFFDKPESVVNHRCLGLANVTAIKIGSTLYTTRA